MEQADGEDTEGEELQMGCLGESDGEGQEDVVKCACNVSKGGDLFPSLDALEEKEGALNPVIVAGECDKKSSLKKKERKDEEIKSYLQGSK